MIMPKCKQNRHDCFSIDELGRCHCLNRTDFKKPNGKQYKCPFYKPRTDVADVLDKIRELENEDDDTTEMGV